MARVFPGLTFFCPGGRVGVEEVAVRAAKKAGGLLKERFGSPGKVSSKGDEGIVTELDLAADRLIKEEIWGAFPDHGILSEESPEEKRHGDKRWIIDPLDGTTNYSHAFPHFSVSIGFEENGVITFGVIFDPMRDELFTAKPGRGAHLNGVRLKVSDTGEMHNSIIAFDFPRAMASPGADVFKSFAALSGRSRALRTIGSAALELCYVASGRLDGYWNYRFHSWDAAAGSLILNEAGGMITDLKGGSFTMESKQCVASNGHIHESILKGMA